MTASSSDRRLVALGLALLIAVPVSAYGLSEAGATYGLAASAKAPTFSLGQTTEYSVCGSQETLCDLASESCCYGPSGGGVASAGSTGVVVVGLDSFTSNRGRLESVSATDFHTVSVVNLTCNPTDVYSPGEGSETYSACQGGPTDINESILVYDAPSGTVRSSIPLPPDGYPVFGMALDAEQNRLYCLRGNETIDVVDPTAGTAVATLQPQGASPRQVGPLPFGSPLWFDANGSHLFVANSTGSSLDEVDPGTGRVTASISMPGRVQTVTGDSPDGRLYVSYTPTTETQAKGTEIVDLATLEVVGHWNAWSEYPVLFDRAHGEAYLDEAGVIAAFGLSSGLAIPNPSLPIQEGPFGSPVTFVGSTDQIVVVMDSFDSTYAYLIVVGAMPGTTAPAPYSAVPGVGAALPTLVAVGLAVAGFGLLAVGWRRKQQREWLAGGTL